MCNDKQQCDQAVVITSTDGRTYVSCPACGYDNAPIIDEEDTLRVDTEPVFLSIDLWGRFDDDPS